MDDEAIVRGRAGRLQRRVKRAGWTKAAREGFLEHLALTCSVIRAAAHVGRSPSGAYRLRADEPAFADAWRRAIETGYSAEAAETLRGPEHNAAWCDEIGKWGRGGEAAWDNLMMGLRLGDHARVGVDLNRVTALSEDRERLWRQVSAADFLSREEKRGMLGIA